MTYIPPDSIPPTKPVDHQQALVAPKYALLIAEDQAAISPAFRWPVVKCDANGYLTTSRPPNSQVTFTKRTPHSLATVQRLDIGFLGSNRDQLSVFNESTDWLVIHLSSFPPPLGLSTYTTIIREFEEWRAQYTSPFYGGPVWGYWIPPMLPTAQHPGLPVVPHLGAALCSELT